MEAKSYNEADLPFFIAASLVRLIQSFRYVGRDRRGNETRRVRACKQPSESTVLVVTRIHNAREIFSRQSSSQKNKNKKNFRVGVCVRPFCGELIDCVLFVWAVCRCSASSHGPKNTTSIFTDI